MQTHALEICHGSICMNTSCLGRVWSEWHGSSLVDLHGRVWSEWHGSSLVELRGRVFSEWHGSSLVDLQPRKWRFKLRVTQFNVV